LIFEPINHWTGRPHFLKKLRDGDWRIVLSLALGALICGFFWEMWNYYSFPKWVYHTPGTEFLRIFEMPLLGYGGYIPFALELYALKSSSGRPDRGSSPSSPRRGFNRSGINIGEWSNALNSRDGPACVRLSYAGGLFFLRMKLRPALQRKNLRTIKLPLKIVPI
jgi:hypothetical protein